MNNGKTLCTTFQTYTELVDRDPEYLNFINEELARKLVDALVGRLSNGEKIVRLCDLEERQSVNFGMVEYRKNIVTEELVRCKDCIYWEEGRLFGGNCNRAVEITVYASDYCSFGERRSNGQADK